MPTFYGIGRSTVDVFIPVNKIPLKFADQNLTRLSQDEMEKIYPNLEKHKANNIKKLQKLQKNIQKINFLKMNNILLVLHILDKTIMKRQKIILEQKVFMLCFIQEFVNLPKEK